METLQKYLGQVKVPCATDNVYKEECVLSFDTPETPTGLYVSLTSFLGFGVEYAGRYAERSGHRVFLHLKRDKIEIPDASTTGTGGGADGPEKKITRLAIGVEGGATTESKKYEYTEHYKVVVYEAGSAAGPPTVSLEYPNTDLPLLVQNAVDAIQRAEAASVKREREQLAGTWDGEIRQVSRHAADLLQLDNGRKIPPTGWKCEKCDLTSNLWLNLTDGSIMCGRKFFDGSGGNDHAVNHYKETSYPLAVKLGTITADGKGDVYSYSEDDMVEDPHLVKHLAHWGINVGQLEKTEKSMIELELDLNQRIGEWGILCESASQLKPIAGPGYTGMKNLGNTCYLNSVMQVMFTIPDFVRRFVEGADAIFERAPADPANDFNVQMAKLGTGLCSGKYSVLSDNTLDTIDSSSGGIAPTMFKALIGRGHPDFSTKQQQDAQEFFLHLVSSLEKHSRQPPAANPAEALKFCIEDRVECCSSGKVMYNRRDEWCLPLQIPLQKATNIEEVKRYEAEREAAEKEGRRLDPDSLVRPKIPLSACLDTFAQPELVEQFYSSAINAKTTAKKTTKLASMPDYLMLHLKKFTLKEDWTSIKLDVAIDIPEVLDLETLRGTGKQPDEEELPDIVGRPPTPPPMDPEVMEQLIGMGFPPEACKRAIFFTKNTGIEPATQWMMEHIADADFAAPFVPPGTGGKSGAAGSAAAAAAAAAFTPDPVGLEMLMGMGFTDRQATKALRETGNNTERAVDWIFSHTDELDTMAIDDATFDSVATAAAAAAGGGGSAGASAASSAGAAQASAGKSSGPTYRDGTGKYKLVAFISHMGTSAQVGHYVCHILKDGQWVIFNDNKVAISQNPPKELGYLYLYQRVRPAACDTLRYGPEDMRSQKKCHEFPSFSSK
ncbi:ubiquitin carboxyl-terminal hydrolase 5 isoform X2 [Anopheles darlingi]|uniref:ubiquitin carboxyl-terminal hydrolase 5 isoform X2 n=2 Tax=Anopheles darlingi TaxID=43151 RepID=UPI002100235C|nr:ubiquitin carboxyl-terminal hydrolase 5 isoform X2 [Anopheles darlingi]